MSIAQKVHFVSVHYIPFGTYTNMEETQLSRGEKKIRWKSGQDGWIPEQSLNIFSVSKYLSSILCDQKESLSLLAGC